MSTPTPMDQLLLDQLRDAILHATTLEERFCRKGMQALPFAEIERTMAAMRDAPPINVQGDIADLDPEWIKGFVQEIWTAAVGHCIQKFAANVPKLIVMSRLSVPTGTRKRIVRDSVGLISGVIEE